MDQFSISQLAKYSGIKPHTIRMWEKRYNALDPWRSEGNTRYYNGEQLKRLLNLVSLKVEEPNLSVLCSYTNEELNEKTERLFLKGLNRGDRAEFFVYQFIASGISYDENSFNKYFKKLLEEYDAETAYTKVIYPLMQRIGLMWSCDSMNAASEHFVSNLLKQKFYAMIDSLPAAKPTSPRWLLFLREGEFHEIGLLFSSYLIRKAGGTVIYLGANTPLATLGETADNAGASKLLFFYMQHEPVEELKAFIESLGTLSKTTSIYIAGSLDQRKLAKYKNITVLNSIEQFKLILAGSEADQ
jgi:methanogenic corrinoid protein MtbC1